MSNEVADFFNRVADEYHAADRGQAGTHLDLTARRLNAAATGRLLSVGGLWEGARLDACDEVVVADVSDEMLQAYRAQNVSLRVCDARELPFADESFDRVMFPLVLHHITDGSARASRRNIDAALGEAFRVLRPGGQVWIREWVVARSLYWTELALAPLTKRVLGAAGIPLVVMHSERFLVDACRGAGFRDVSSDRLFPSEPKPGAFIQPIVGAPYLKLPRAVVPTRPVVVRGSRGGRRT